MIGAIWLDLERAVYIDGSTRYARRLVDWGTVTDLEDNTLKAYKKAKTVVFRNNGEPIWVIETIEEILAQAGVANIRDDMGFKGGNHE